MRLLSLAALLIAGCATTIPSMRDGEPYATLEIAAAPQALAECARGQLLQLGPDANSVMHSATPAVHAGDDRVILTGRNPYGVPYFADLFPVDGATRALVYASTGYIGRRDTGDTVVAILRDCA